MNIFIAILILGLIIFIHELGHFLLAKANGITVTEFSLGMGPRLISFVKGETRYSLKIFPIGGSCMMLGEDEDIEDEGAFNKKGVWARFSVIFAGAFFNFILAFVLAVVVIGAIGFDYPDVTSAPEGSAIYEAGLREGDRITKLNGKKIHFGREIDMYLFFDPVNENPIEVTYERDGKTLEATIYPKRLPSFYKLGFGYNGGMGPLEVHGVEMDFPFYEAGIKAGDIIKGINGTPIESGDDLVNYLNENPLTGETLNIKYLRGQEELEVEVTPRLVENSYSLGNFYNIYREKSSPFETVKYSFFELRFNILNAVESLKYMISGKASLNQISGPVGIVSLVDNIVDQTEKEGAGIVLLNLANFAIMLSANLGVINLLPFPALDGGRLVFIIIEAIRKKPISKDKEAMVHFVGIVLLMMLMVVVLYNDIRKLF